LDITVPERGRGAYGLSAIDEPARPTAASSRRASEGNSIALGVAIASFGWLLGESDAVRPLLAIGNIPFLVGLALVRLWKFAPREDRRT
jgi:hypothetical protein